MEWGMKIVQQIFSCCIINEFTPFYYYLHPYSIHKIKQNKKKCEDKWMGGTALWAIFIILYYHKNKMDMKIRSTQIIYPDFMTVLQIKYYINKNNWISIHIIPKTQHIIVIDMKKFITLNSFVNGNHIIIASFYL